MRYCPAPSSLGTVRNGQPGSGLAGYKNSDPGPEESRRLIGFIQKRNRDLPLNHDLLLARVSNIPLSGGHGCQRKMWFGADNKNDHFWARDRDRFVNRYRQHGSHPRSGVRSSHSRIAAIGSTPYERRASLQREQPRAAELSQVRQAIHEPCVAHRVGWGGKSCTRFYVSVYDSRSLYVPREQGADRRILTLAFRILRRTSQPRLGHSERHREQAELCSQVRIRLRCLGTIRTVFPQ